MSRLNKNLQSKRKGICTRSPCPRNTIETPLLGFTKFIPDPTLALLPSWGASSAALWWRFFFPFFAGWRHRLERRSWIFFFFFNPQSLWCWSRTGQVTGLSHFKACNETLQCSARSYRCSSNGFSRFDFEQDGLFFFPVMLCRDDNSDVCHTSQCARKQQHLLFSVASVGENDKKKKKKRGLNQMFY